MRHITSCFFCSTPYQIIAAVSIVRQNHETADLYVLFDGPKDYLEGIRKENIFSEVKFVEKINSTSAYRLLQRLGNLGKYVKCDRIAEEILVPNTRYNKLYFSNRGIEARCCFFHYVKNNIPIERILFDDGASSYLNDFYVYIRKEDALVRKLLFGEKALEPVSRKMLYSPDLYQMTCKSTKKYKIEKIDGKFDNYETKELCNRIFQFKDSDLIKENCILLDCIKDEILDKEGQKKLQFLYRKIFQEYGAENIIVKPHPRDNAKMEGGAKYYSNYKLPLECLYMNLNCSEKVLISVSSTAVATPKILFDQEPYVILLYRLLDLKKINMDDLDRYYRNCKSLYRHPERFMIPENEEELTEYLKQKKI